MTSDRPQGNRRSIRLPGYDYTQPGAYFVTICTCGGECLFDNPILRRVVETAWQELPRHFPRLSLDAWVVMPNHFHAIPILSDAGVVGAMHSYQDLAAMRGVAPGEMPDVAMGLSGNASPLRFPSGAARGSLGAIIGNFKSVAARRINQIRDTPGGAGLAAQLLRAHHPDGARPASHPGLHQPESGALAHGQVQYLGQRA